MDRQRTSARRRRQRLGPLQKFITILLTAMILAFGLMVFFRVSTIQVEGNNQYTDDQIIECSGIATGENLILVNKNLADNLIRSQLPYVSEIKIVRKLPDTIVIYVTESGAAATVTDVNGTSWDIDSNCKVLNQAAESSSTVTVTGFTPRAAIKSEQLNAAEGDEEKLTQLKNILKALAKNELLSRISSLDLTNAYDPVLFCDGKYNVRLGVTTDIDYKLQYMVEVIKQLTDNQSGTIDLTFEADEFAHFMPE